MSLGYKFRRLVILYFKYNFYSILFSMTRDLSKMIAIDKKMDAIIKELNLLFPTKK